MSYKILKRVLSIDIVNTILKYITPNNADYHMYKIYCNHHFKYIEQFKYNIKLLNSKERVNPLDIYDNIKIINEMKTNNSYEMYSYFIAIRSLPNLKRIMLYVENVPKNLTNDIIFNIIVKHRETDDIIFNTKVHCGQSLIFKLICVCVVTIVILRS